MKIKNKKIDIYLSFLIKNRKREVGGLKIGLENISPIFCRQEEPKTIAGEWSYIWIVSICKLHAIYVYFQAL